MMKHFILSILTILVILQSCNPAVNDVTPDETAKKIFTRTELEGIGQMIRFVDSIVLAKTGHTEINEGYRACFDKLNGDIMNVKGLTPLLNDTAKFKFFETMDSEAFSAIWREGIALITAWLLKNSHELDFTVYKHRS